MANSGGIQDFRGVDIITIPGGHRGLWACTPKIVMVTMCHFINKTCNVDIITESEGHSGFQ